MKKMYVIGNGFDLHHGLNTRYQSFAFYLAEDNREIYNLLNTYYGLPDITNPKTTDDEYGQWSRFEEALADLDYQGVLEDNSDLIANPASDDFRDRDWHSYQIEMELIIKQLTTELKANFNKFILNVAYDKDLSAVKLLDISKDSIFLNFNYTETLEKYYNIDPALIKYIHNKADNLNVNIILGHGTDPEGFNEPEETPPDGLTPEELDEWNEQKGEEYDFSYEMAKQEILGYYFASFKDTQSIIHDSTDFFDSLKSIEEVYVLGHSISHVDIEYFIKLKSSLPNTIKWVVSYFSERERNAHLEALLGLGIAPNNIRQIKLVDLVIV